MTSSTYLRIPTRQHGIALITSMLMLVIVTLVTVSMYRSFGLQEKIAGNTLEKQRSLVAADSAVRYGEWWLSQGNTGTAVACNGAINGNVLTNLKVCTDTLLTPGTLPWTNRFEYSPPQMTVAVGGGLNTGSNGVSGDVNYAVTPALHISYLGVGIDGKSVLYQVTGVGYGGSNTSASVMQSVYSMKYRVNDLSGL